MIVISEKVDNVEMVIFVKIDIAISTIISHDPEQKEEVNSKM
jgi:hypothetical protein